ncbi:hypothetical protein CRG98_034369 [Punica granatum]|uniref:Uncharacterized protein n=1 Tax=Punica granatum TaxID=22663 RepID=A0A2I0IML7_PUNGR|nr:hypothetical protein CRG98_034369 [Punica granatum]
MSMAVAASSAPKRRRVGFHRGAEPQGVLGTTRQMGLILIVEIDTVENNLHHSFRRASRWSSTAIPWRSSAIPMTTRGEERGIGGDAGCHRKSSRPEGRGRARLSNGVVGGTGRAGERAVNEGFTLLSRGIKQRGEIRVH